MDPIKVPTTPDELKALGREWNAAQYFANASDDPEEIKRANDRITECEAAIGACPFTFDEDGNVVSNKPEVAEFEPVTEPTVTEMAICEVPWLMLRPNQLYKFIEMPGCPACAAAVAPFKIAV